MTIPERSARLTASPEMPHSSRSASANRLARERRNRQFHGLAAAGVLHPIACCARRGAGAVADTPSAMNSSEDGQRIEASCSSNPTSNVPPDTVDTRRTCSSSSSLGEQLENAEVEHHRAHTAARKRKRDGRCRRRCHARTTPAMIRTSSSLTITETAGSPSSAIPTAR